MQVILKNDFALWLTMTRREMAGERGRLEAGSVTNAVARIEVVSAAAV
jgi:hypothetical protein